MKRRVSLSTMFYIKRTKLLRNGEAPIYVRLSFNKTKTEMGINKSISPKLWNTEFGIAKGKSHEAKQLNLYMKTIEFQLNEHLRFLREDSKEITAKAIKNSFLGLNAERKTILGIFREHNDDLRKRVGKDFSKGTLQKYEACRSHLEAYIKKRYKEDDKYLFELDFDFIRYFESFLKTEKGNNHNTAIKFLTNLKKVVRIALANGWIKKDPFVQYKLNLKKVDRGFLNDDELQAIINLNTRIERLENVKDCFLVSCFTGLAYSDLKMLSSKNVISSNGKKWIQINRKKTDVQSKIPILPVVEKIIERYKGYPGAGVSDEPKLLPVLSNQKMNAYLKEVADLAKINKNLTTHIARHTFATTVTLNNDVPIETVSKMLGHSSINMTKTYARLLDKKVSSDMDKIYEKYS
jgi:site-specific recombinase XerD